MGICKFEIGDLVRCSWTGDIGVVQKVDPAAAIQQRLTDFLACAASGIAIGHGIRDRLLIQWTTDYERSRGRDGEMRHYVDSKDVKKV